MKNIVLIMTLIVSCLFAGCDSLANKSEDKLSGDDFWAQGNETNAEAFLLSIYNSFRNATMSQRPFLTYSGDMRCAPITAYSTGDKYVAYLANNDMGELRNTYPDDARGGLIMQWDVTTILRCCMLWIVRILLLPEKEHWLLLWILGKSGSSVLNLTWML